MIRDLEGAETGGPTGPRWLLPAGTAACVGAFIVALLTFRPAPIPDVASSSGVMLGPSVIAQVTPAPTRVAGPSLELPQGSFSAVTRLNLSGITGLVPASAAEAGVQLRYRLQDGRSLLLTRSRDALTPQAGPSTPVQVRGRAALLVATPGQPLSLIWAEAPFHYALASSTHSGSELLAIAERLR